MTPARSLAKTELTWILGLRWIVIVVLVCSLPASSELLGLSVIYPAALAAIGVLIALNLAHRRIEALLPSWARAHLVLANVAADVLAIAGFLAASGGAANPFSSILLVYVALGASLLGARQAFALAALAACTFGALFLVPGSGECCEPAISPSFSNHLYGMWVAFVLGAALVAFFLTRVRHAMEARERELQDLRLRAERADKFEAVATLAAGTAHELGTPLATIRVLAGELQERARDPEVEAQGARIADQIDRCRSVLDRMRPGASPSTRGESDLAQSVRAAVAAWRAAHPGALVELDPLEPLRVPLDSSEVEAAIMVLLDNAHAATEQAQTSGPIIVRSGTVDREPFVSVEDDGVGVAAEAARHVGEPFFTTKPPGSGMGLGLFVVRSLLHPLGGRIEIERKAPGTRVRLWFGTRGSLHA